LPERLHVQRLAETVWGAGGARLRVHRDRRAKELLATRDAAAVYTVRRCTPTD